MVRIIGFFVGLFFALGVLWAFVNGAYNAATDPAGSSRSLIHTAIAESVG